MLKQLILLVSQLILTFFFQESIFLHWARSAFNSSPIQQILVLYSCEGIFPLLKFMWGNLPFVEIHVRDFSFCWNSHEGTSLVQIHVRDFSLFSNSCEGITLCWKSCDAAARITLFEVFFFYNFCWRLFWKLLCDVLKCNNSKNLFFFYSYLRAVFI